jgi:hypothetical protein
MKIGEVWTRPVGRSFVSSFLDREFNVNTPIEREEALPSKRKSLIPARRVWERFNVTDRTLARWLDKPDLNFPRPVMTINGRRYWDEDVLDAWERDRAATQTEAA